MTGVSLGRPRQAGSNRARPFGRLRDLGLIERHVPATIPPDPRRTIIRSRDHLRDPYLRFDFRFIEPHLAFIEQELTAVLWDRLSAQFSAFVGATAFEDLCREWVLVQARAGGSCRWRRSWSAATGCRMHR
jgi:uncharacterized protein